MTPGTSIPPRAIAHRNMAFLQHRRLATARREKRINGPPPQPTLPAVRHAILELLVLMHRSKEQLYSITSSARSRNDSGIVRPSVLAVFRLITTYLVGCWGQIASLLAAKDTINIRRGAAVLFNAIRAVVNQPPARHEGRSE
jgi:hypothetical protein